MMNAASTMSKHPGDGLTTLQWDALQTAALCGPIGSAPNLDPYRRFGRRTIESLAKRGLVRVSTNGRFVRATVTPAARRQFTG